jgi:hypothetical protein
MAFLSISRTLGAAQTVGLAWTAYEMTSAAIDSVRRRSWRPLAVESVGQAGSWAAGVAGLKVGCKLGVVAGLSTGAGAVVTATLGAGIGGLAGYVIARRAALRAGLDPAAAPRV